MPTSIMAGMEELKQLRSKLQKPSKESKLLNSADIAGAMDYPKAALANKEQGTVQAWLLVGIDGRVERCGIEISSGAASLDSQTCNLLIAKAQFEPARDRRGRPVQSVFHQRITWRLQDNVKPKDMATRMSIVVGPANEVRSCKVEFFYSEQWHEAPQSLCDEFLKRGTGLLAAVRAKSKVHDALVVLETWTFTTPGKPIPSVGRGAGETLVALRSATASYSVDGKRTGCTSGESFGFPGVLDDVCVANVEGGIPLEMPQRDGEPVENLRVLEAIYLKDEPS
jgi:TonB family protein